MTLGTYTAIGWRPMHVNGSAMAHLVPPRPGPLATTACGRIRLEHATLTRPDGLLGLAVTLCGPCERRDGTAGPAHDGRLEGMGQ